VLFGIVSPLIKIKSLDRDTIAIATCTVPEPNPDDESRRGSSTCTTAMACAAASPPLFAPPRSTAAASSRAPSERALHCVDELLHSAPFTAGARPSMLERVHTPSARCRLHLLPELTGATTPGPTRSYATSRSYALPPDAMGGPGPPALVFMVDAATEPAELARARLLDRSTSTSVGARLPDRSTSTSVAVHTGAGRWRSARRSAPKWWRRRRVR
jgi:hypothetical protein